MAIHIASSPYRSTFQPGMASRSRSFSRVEYSGATTSLGSLFQNLKTKKSERLRFSVGPLAIIVGLGVVAALMSTLFLINFNNVATNGYALKHVERNHQELVDQYEIQNMKLAELASMRTIIQSEKVSSMRHPRNVMFVRGNTAVASR